MLICLQNSPQKISQMKKKRFEPKNKETSWMPNNNDKEKNSTRYIPGNLITAKFPVWKEIV